MPNFKRAKAAALQVPEIKAELERYLTLKRRIYDGDIITLSKEVCDAITPIYVGKEPRLVMEWAARDRLAAKNDAKALVKAIAAQHRKSYPQFYK
jgi:hypothetical protein